jgi:hypothetical protein
MLVVFESLDLIRAEEIICGLAEGNIAQTL